MGFEPLEWYCRPVANGIWARSTDSAFSAYTPCAVDSLVIFHILLGSSGPLLLPNLVDQDNFKSAEVPLEVEMLQLYVGIAFFLLHCRACAEVGDGLFGFQPGWPD
ncbi:hypothetical protein ACJRO7_016977 [Eucalyptus globulus]|uniref:Chlorophyll a-b binding protein, chloroplastic n=1 Tax=Eucalyptus globulus TaxID=34317 RepID=A0ABD3KPZ3_EUCGL